MRRGHRGTGHGGSGCSGVDISTEDVVTRGKNLNTASVTAVIGHCVALVSGANSEDVLVISR